jgi:hypothetical protein
MKHEREDHVIAELVPDPKSRHGLSPKLTLPTDVLHIESREELEAHLRHFSRPFLKHLHATPFARRNHVEKIRPALRYYCKKFGVELPDWLKDDSYYTDLPDHEKRDLFGTHQLNIREFKRIGANLPGKGRVVP